jgi:hypothetical protein
VNTVCNPNTKKNRKGLPLCKKQSWKMCSWNLVCSKLGGQLYVARQEHGPWRPCMRW